MAYNVRFRSPPALSLALSLCFQSLYFDASVFFQHAAAVIFDYGTDVVASCRKCMQRVER